MPQAATACRRRHFTAMRGSAASNARLLEMLGKLAALTPTHTRRSEESQHLQQFSIELGFIAGPAASMAHVDLVPEPSGATLIDSLLIWWGASFRW